MLEGNEGGIRTVFSGRNVFVTGGTGFVGLVLVEKLLRAVPDLGKIFILIRSKRGKSPEQRMLEYRTSSVFNRLKEERGNEVLDKVTPVEGDVGVEGLGLSEEDRRKLVDEVNVVIHSAATLDFEANLSTTTNINLLGTKRVLDLCHDMKQLKVMVHVSSAYVNSHMTRAEEKLYPVDKTTEEVVALVKSLSEEELAKETPKILGKYLNTYTFTKALAEVEVAAAFKSFPTCIVRPSMIVAAWQEPMPGWTNSKNGPQGFIMGASKGVVRRLPVDPSIIADFIPVDIVVNCLLAGAWHTVNTKPAETPIFQTTSSSYKPFKWNMVTDIMDTSLHRYPLKSAVWYPYLKFIPSIFWFKISAFIFHILPAAVLDFVTFLTGGRPILLRMHRNINESLKRLEPFIFTEWVFDTKRTMAMFDSMSVGDQKTFNLDIATINWEKFMDTLVQGVRTYLHNEKPSSLPSARKKDKILEVMNYALQGVLMISIWYLFTVCHGGSLLDNSWALLLLCIVFSRL